MTPDRLKFLRPGDTVILLCDCHKGQSMIVQIIDYNLVSGTTGREIVSVRPSQVDFPEYTARDKLREQIANGSESTDEDEP